MRYIKSVWGGTDTILGAQKNSSFLIDCKRNCQAVETAWNDQINYQHKSQNKCCDDVMSFLLNIFPVHSFCFVYFEFLGFVLFTG